MSNLKLNDSNLKLNEPLAPHTSWHIGGKAKQYYAPKNAEDLSNFLSTLNPNEPLLWLGLGSNVLISDEGFPGTVIHTLKMEGSIQEMETNSNSISNSVILRVDAGITCAKVAKYCAAHQLGGGAFFAGIPGTVGGALAMNAGAFGGETWNHVTKVEVINAKGQRTFRTPSEYQIGYRTVKRNTAGVDSTEWFLAGYFSFTKDNGNETAQKIKELLKRRNETQPIGVFSCGSVFKNPPNDYAARLIESAGLKGHRIGQAEISPKHANFIINLGNAKAKEVRDLIAYIQDQVFKQHKILLEPEVRFLGF